MSSTSTILRQPAMATAPSKPPPRPYKDFLTPALHRRFARASLATLLPCYVISVWMGEWDFVWQWFPIGEAGIRTLLLFIPVLAIYILRVAQWHYGPRITTSEFDTFLHFAVRPGSLQTFAWYGFSAWFFGEVYIWSRGPEAELATVNPGRSYERARLNERPICLRYMFVFLGVTQAVIHLYRDYDRVKAPFGRPKNDAASNASTAPLTTAQQLTQPLIPIAVQASYRSGILTIAALLSYLMTPGLRLWLWNFWFSIAKRIFTLPKNSKPTRFPPYLADLIGRFLVEAFLLIFLWEFVVEVFNVFLSQEPVKKGQPITNDSKDPDGSLLNGLKSKKEVLRTTAFRELTLIAYEFPNRRIGIYRDIERPTGSAWSQILTVCLGELHAITKRIQDVQNPPSASNDEVQQPQQPPVQTLARIAQPLKQENILTNSPPPKSFNSWAAGEVSSFAKHRGEHPGASNPVSPRLRKLLTYSTNNGLAKEHPSQSPQPSYSKAWSLWIIQWTGGLFRHTFARRAAAGVLGTPYGALSPIVAAASALSKLAICSIKEDDMGLVSRDVANIVRTFTATITSIDAFMKSLPPHWTDIDFKIGDERRTKDVELVLSALKEGLAELVSEFSEYRDDLGLSMKEIRMAKEAVSQGREPQMIQK